MGISTRPAVSRRLKIIAQVVLASLPVTASAADKFWAGGNGYWQTGTWMNSASSVVPAPVAGDSAFLLSTGTITVTRDATGGSLSGLATVQVDGGASGLATLNKLGTTLLGATTLTVGQSGNAAMSIGAGTISTNFFTAGNQVGAAGSVSFGGGTVNTVWQGSTFVIGASGFGTFNHTGGALTYSSALTLGQNAGSSGVYTMSGGTLNAAVNSLTATVGASGYGEFNLDGGIGTLGNLSVGFNPGGYGVVNVNNGFLFVNNVLRLGLNGRGIFQVFGGQTTIAAIFGSAGGELVNYSGDVFVTSGVSLTGGHVDLGTSGFNLSGTNYLTISEAYFGAGNITPLGGASVAFSSGTLAINNGNFVPANGLLGLGSIVLPQTKSLLVSGTTTLQAAQPLVINGGTFSTGILAGNPAALQFLSGTFRLTGSDLNFGVNGLFGQTYTVDSSKRIEVRNGYSATIEPDAQVYVTGGALIADGAVVNQGLLQLAAPTARVGADTLYNQGLLAGTGRILASLFNEPPGEVRVAANDQIRFEAPVHNNYGLLTIVGGFADFNGALNNSGRIVGRGTLRSTSLQNNGTLALSAGVTDVHGQIYNNDGAHIIVSGNGNVSFWGNIVNDVGGSIKVSPGSVASFFGTYAGIGITGGGSINFESDITPGFSPAAISLAGNVDFGSDAKLRIELGGTVRGTQYDAIDITGSANLDGELHLSNLNGFIPLPGMTFNVLSFASHLDQFELVNDTGLAGLIVSTHYSATSLQLEIDGLGGDANLDGKVDIRDLYILASHYKQSGTNWLTADFTSDGLVNAVDLGVLARHWQVSLGVPGSAIPASLLASLGLPNTSTPEPTALIPLVGIATLLRRRRLRV